MDSRTVLFDSELFECVSFFDIDSQESGIDIYYIENKSHVGQLEGIELPDEEDSESISEFEIIVTTWLSRQDINYTLG